MCQVHPKIKGEWLSWIYLVFIYHGDSVMAPAGTGKSASRIAMRRAKVSPPPAESPAITIFLGSIG